MVYRTFNPLNVGTYVDAEYQAVMVATGPSLIGPDSVDPNPFQLTITTDGGFPELGDFGNAF